MPACNESLQDYLADSVDTFLTDSGSPSTAIPPSLAPNGSHDAILEDNSDSSSIPLALTFSFPVEQTALDSGKLLTWTKGFSAKNAIGKDVVKLLQDAFDRKHIHVRCVALVNDVSIHISIILISPFRNLRDRMTEISICRLSVPFYHGHTRQEDAFLAPSSVPAPTGPTWRRSPISRNSEMRQRPQRVDI